MGDLPARRDARRRQMLDAALACFLEYGYAKTVFEDVSRKAGVSRSLLYAYFKDKNDLFMSVVQDCLEDARRRTEVVLGSRARDDEKLRQVLDVWCVELYALGSDSPHGRELIAEGTRAWDEAGIKYRDYLIRVLARLLGDPAVAELLVLSVRGLQADRPSVPCLRKRIRLMAELAWQKGRRR